jgi:hypothetical protein
MIRILIIDDLPSPEFVEEMKRTIAGSFDAEDVETRHLNPVDLLAGNSNREALGALLDAIATVANEFWDVVIIDVNLAEVSLPEDQRLDLSLLIAARIREANRSATVMLYSGTLSDHVRKLLGGAVPAEAALKKIFKGGISQFVRRDMVVREVLSAVDDPSWLLRVDRLLMKYATMVVGPEEAEFKGRSFAELAQAVRRQDHDGQKITQLTAEYGVSCFADLST